MYAKLINGKLTPAPANLCKDGTVYQNYNLESNAAMLLADGYKPVAEMPAPDEMKNRKILCRKRKQDNGSLCRNLRRTGLPEQTSRRISRLQRIS